MALKREELKGPEFKNRKPWTEESTLVPMVSSGKSELKGPEAKNYKPFNRTSSKAGFLANSKK